MVISQDLVREGDRLLAVATADAANGRLGAARLALGAARSSYQRSESGEGREEGKG